MIQNLYHLNVASRRLQRRIKEKELESKNHLFINRIVKIKTNVNPIFADTAPLENSRHKKKSNRSVMLPPIQSTEPLWFLMFLLITIKCTQVVISEAIVPRLYFLKQNQLIISTREQLNIPSNINQRTKVLMTVLLVNMKKINPWGKQPRSPLKLQISIQLGRMAFKSTTKPTINRN